MTSIVNLPNFVAYFGASVLLLAAFLALYTLITPIREWQLIRQGNVAAAVSLVGAMIGFCRASWKRGEAPAHLAPASPVLPTYREREADCPSLRVE